jgi:hypothetical protein
VTPAQVPIQNERRGRRLGKNSIQPSNGLHPHPSILCLRASGLRGYWRFNPSPSSALRAPSPLQGEASKGIFSLVGTAAQFSSPRKREDVTQWQVRDLIQQRALNFALSASGHHLPWSGEASKARGWLARWEWANGGPASLLRVARFDVGFEVVQDGLPALALLVFGVGGFGIEGFADGDAIRIRDEFDRKHAVA